MHRDAKTYVHINWNRLTSSCVVIDKNDHHHPASPLICLVSMHDHRVAGLLTEEDTNNCYVEYREPEVYRSEVFVLFHKEVGSVTDIEVTDNDRELGNAEDEICNIIDRKIALPQLT